MRALPAPRGRARWTRCRTSALRPLPRLPTLPPSVAAVSALVCRACAYRDLPRVTAQHRMYA